MNGSLPINIAEHENWVRERSRPEGRNTTLPACPWVRLWTGCRHFKRYSLPLTSRVLREKYWNLEKDPKALHLKICAMPLSMISAQTTYGFIVLYNLYARMKKKLDVDFFFINTIVYSKNHSREIWKRSVDHPVYLPANRRLFPYGTLSSVFK